MLPQPTAERTVEVLGHVAPAATWQRALDRAHQSGIKVHRIGAEWYATSASQPGQFHHVNGSCDCQGAQHGHLCQHVAAVASARIRQGELGRCAECGRVLPLAQLEGEWRHVGGADDRLELFCAAGVGHRARPALREVW